MSLHRCDYCLKECTKTKYGSCVILTKKDIILCMKCNHNRLELERFKFNTGLLNYLKYREISQYQQKY